MVSLTDGTTVSGNTAVGDGGGLLVRYSNADVWNSTVTGNTAALGGGVYPVSAVVAKREVLDVFKPGDHGSTFGGNPLGAAVARAALKVIVEEGLVENAAQMGQYFRDHLEEINSPHIDHIRGKGLLIGVVLKSEAGGARRFCEELQRRGILAKETHEHVIRFAPPLIIKKDEIDRALERINTVLV